MIKRIINRLFLFWILIFCQISCQRVPIVTAEVQDDELPIYNIPTVIQDDLSINGHPTQTPFLTPTPDTRLLPFDWKNWSIIPLPTNRTIEIYINGIEQGNSPNAFSKIGDCQNVSSAFLGIFDRGGCSLLNGQEDWNETIINFRGSFNRDGESFGQGLNVAAALSPFHANSEVCLADEGPLLCELRIAKTSFAFISFERWWPDITPPEEYEKYLRIVIETVISNGTVPILITKADNIEGNHTINQIIAKLAYEYDIPLFNWWKAAQALPYRGMDLERNDGFHISERAWYERSIFGLGTLDSIWKGVTNN